MGSGRQQLPFGAIHRRSRAPAVFQGPSPALCAAGRPDTGPLGLTRGDAVNHALKGRQRALGNTLPAMRGISGPTLEPRRSSSPRGTRSDEAQGVTPSGAVTAGLWKAGDEAPPAEGPRWETPELDRQRKCQSWGKPAMKESTHSGVQGGLMGWVCPSSKSQAEVPTLRV